MNETRMAHSIFYTAGSGGTRRCSWLRHCATSRKVAVSISDGVTGSGVDSASNMNGY